MFYFLLFFLAQSQIVQTQSINSRSISLSHPCSLLQTLHIRFWVLLILCQENKPFFYFCCQTHYTFLSNLYNCCIGGENRTLVYYISCCVWALRQWFFCFNCFLFSFICFNSTNYNSSYYCLFQHSLRRLVPFNRYSSSSDFFLNCCLWEHSLSVSLTLWELFQQLSFLFRDNYFLDGFRLSGGGKIRWKL